MYVTQIFYNKFYMTTHGVGRCTGTDGDTIHMDFDGEPMDLTPADIEHEVPAPGTVKR